MIYENCQINIFKHGITQAANSNNNAHTTLDGVIWTVWAIARSIGLFVHQRDANASTWLCRIDEPSGGGGGRNLDMKAGIIKAVSDVSYTLICAAAQKPLNEHAQGYKDSHTITHIYIQREVFSRPGDTFVTKFNFSLAFNANSSVNSHSQNICFPDFYNPT